VKTGTHKAFVGAGAGTGASAGAETFWKSEPELEPKQKVSAPQHCFLIHTYMFVFNMSVQHAVFRIRI
jgi:hypothetical protein